MKKLLALLLAVAMCFSLVACGGENDTPSTNDNDANNTSQESENSTTDNTDYASELTQLLCEKNVWYGMCHGKGSEEEFTFFEDGHFEVNSNSHTWEFKEYHKDATDYLASHSFQTTPDYDAARGLYVTDEFLLGYDTNGNLLLYWRDYFCYNESQYELVEITLDNWNTYFELVVTPEFKQNAFGEYDNFKLSHRFQLKAEYFPLLNAEETKISVEVTYNYVERECNVDFENLTYELGEALRTAQSSQITDYSYANKDYFYFTPFGIQTYFDGKIQYSYEDVEVIRIQGTLCLRIEE